MKTTSYNSILVLLISTLIFSCNKSETAGVNNQVDTDYTTTAEISDSISSVATLQVKDKQFIKSAEVNMEVKDVYDASIYIENTLKNLGGFVTNSQLNSEILSENTFSISDEKSMLVRKFQTYNDMEVRVPTQKLGEFLQLINDKKIFLHSRVILAEDVTANIKLAELETKRNKTTAENIAKLNHNKDKVTTIDDNEREGNYQKMSSFEMTDHLKYSNVHLTLKEPQVRVAQIPVANTKNLDNQYQYNFFYDAKNAIVEGLYLIQKIAIGLLNIWPLILIGGIAFYFFRRRKQSVQISDSESTSK